MKKTLLMLLLMPIVASAADWKNIASSADMLMQIDPGSISLTKNGTRKAWKEFIYDKAQKNRASQPFTRSVMLSLYNCAERTVAPIQEVDYDHVLNGTVVNSVSTPQQKAQFIDVVPGSFDEAALDFVCNAPIIKK